MTTNDKARERAAKMRSIYENDPTTNRMRCILYGGTGSGKTYSIRTMRAPILVHSFDPGGTDSLRGQEGKYETCIDNGSVLVDTRFEHEDPQKPKAFNLWKNTCNELVREKFFDSIGTYVLDSLTTFQSAVMNQILFEKGRTDGQPQLQDWGIQKTAIENSIKNLLALPCDVIIIAHDAANKCEVTGKIEKNILITGQLVRRLPLLVSEIYHAESQSTANGIKHSFLTRKDGTYQARSRLNRGKLEIREVPDFKELYKKMGLDYKDKEAL